MSHISSTCLCWWSQCWTIRIYSWCTPVISLFEGGLLTPYLSLYSTRQLSFWYPSRKSYASGHLCACCGPRTSTSCHRAMMRSIHGKLAPLTTSSASSAARIHLAKSPWTRQRIRQWNVFGELTASALWISRMTSFGLTSFSCTLIYWPLISGSSLLFVWFLSRRLWRS